MLFRVVEDGYDSHVFTFASDNQWKNSKRWNDYFFVPGDPERELNVINLKTGNVENLFNIYLQDDISKDAKGTINYYIVDDLLILSIGEGMKNDATYVYDLPPVQPPHKLTLSNTLGYMKKIGDEYIYIAGYSDGCGGIHKYYSYNKIDGSLSYIADIASGCAGGQQFISMINNSDMVVAYHPEETIVVDMYTPLYTEVSQFSIHEPNNKTILVTNENMPPFIRSLFVDTTSGVIWMIGDSGLYSVALKGGIPIKISDIPKNWDKMYISGIFDKEICVRNNYHLEQQAGSFDMQSLQFHTLSAQCPKDPKLDENAIFYSNSQIKDILLPPDYRIDRVQVEL
jgi:hypothetical protein